MRRFYAPDIRDSMSSVTLSPDESHHARDVLRLRVGDEVTAFDGNGNEFRCTVEHLDRSAALLAIIGRIEPSAPESPLGITLGSVVIPGDKFDLIVQKSVELGVARLVPLTSARSELKLKDLEKKLIRWRRIAFDAAKQCGRAKLMTIDDPFELAKHLDAEAKNDAAKIFFSERDGSRLDVAGSPSDISAVIGPKGGWEDAEIECARTHKFHIATLGGRIMRAETAAIALTAILQHRFGDIN